MIPWSPVILDTASDEDRSALDSLRGDREIEWIDTLEVQRAGLAKLTPPPTDEEKNESPRWIHYPWRRTVVATLGPKGFRKLRLDRNRNKITEAEQERLAGLSIGVVGLSVGHAIAYTIALDGLCGELRLADFDDIELSNLNRIPASLLDLGLDKTVVAARRIAELDPYLKVTIDSHGIRSDNIDSFLTGLDVVVEECDSLDVKVIVREHARAQHIPVIMETSDRGLLDVERFDLEHDRPLFHGILGDIASDVLEGLSTRDKVPYVLAILGAEELSPRIAASMIEVERTVTTWPQLGSEVALGGATVAAAIRRFGLGLDLPSGRARVDLDGHLVQLSSPVTTVAADHTDPQVTADGHLGVLDAARRAPSGGNVQPWRLSQLGNIVTIDSVPERTSGLDVAFRGSHVAVGAAAFNARVAAAHAGTPATVDVSASADGVVEVALTMAPGIDEDLSTLFEAMLARTTNRHLGTPTALEPTVRVALDEAATAEGGRVALITARESLDRIADVLAESDRLRYLTSELHAEMISELRWPGDDDSDAGIEVTSLGMDATDVVKLDVIRRPEVMDLLASWDTGSALGDDTRDRIESASALAVVIVEGREAADFVRGGSAVERVWIAAESLGLAVHPVSPVFIYAHTAAEFEDLSAPYAQRLVDLRHRFTETVGLTDDESIALVLRLSHTARSATRSRRRKE